MLRNEAYCGDILTNKHYQAAGHKMKKNNGERQQFFIEGHHKAIIPRAVFERVNEILDQKLLWKGRVLTDEQKRFLAAALPMDVEEDE